MSRILWLIGAVVFAVGTAVCAVMAALRGRGAAKEVANRLRARAITEAQRIESEALGALQQGYTDADDDAIETAERRARTGDLSGAWNAIARAGRRGSGPGESETD